MTTHPTMSFLYPEWDCNSEIELWTLDQLRTMDSVDSTIQLVDQYTCGRHDVLQIVMEVLDYHAVPWNMSLCDEQYTRWVTVLETLRRQPVSERGGSPDDTCVVIDDSDRGSAVEIPDSPPLVRHLRVADTEQQALYNARRYEQMAQTARCGAEMLEYTRLAEQSMKDALAVAASV